MSWSVGVPGRLVAACAGVALVAAGLVADDGTRRRTGSGADICPDLVNVCDRQAAEIALPVLGTPLLLVYSSDRQRQRPASPDLRRWLGAVGLGGWTLDIVHGLSADGRTLYHGEGGYRAVEPISVRSGQHAGQRAVASMDAGEVYLFDREGRHVSTVDPLTGVVRHSLEYVDGRLAGLAAPDGSALSVRRESGRIVLETAGGRPTTLALDGRGQLARVTTAANAATGVAMDERGLLRRLTSPEGGPYEFFYDGDGRLVERRDPLGHTHRWQRREWADGYSLTTTAPSGAAMVLEVNTRGGVQSRRLRGPDGLVSVERVTARGREHTLPDGTRLEVRLEPDPRWRDQAPVIASATLVAAGGPTVALTSSVSATVADAGDPFRLASMQRRWGIGGRYWVQRFNAADRSLTLMSPEGRVSRAAFDGQGRLVQGDVNGLAPRELTYDDVGRLASVRWAGGRLRFGYGRSGTIEVTAPAGGRHAVAYGADGHLAAHEDAGPTALGHSGVGALTDVTPPGGTTHRLTYHADQSPAAFALDPADPRPTRRWTDDGHGRLSSIQLGDGRTVEISYDSASRPRTLAFDGGQRRYQADAATGQLRTIEGDGGRLSFAYQGPWMTGERWEGAVAGEVGRPLDSALRPAGTTVNGTEAVRYAYDGDGLVVRAGAATLGRGRSTGLVERIEVGRTVEVRTHDGHGLLASRTVMAAGVTVYRLSITRDALGRVSSERSSVAGEAPVTRAYRYDGSGQLVRVDTNGTTTERYAYDARGNRVRVEGAAGATAAVFDGSDRIAAQGPVRYTVGGDGTLRSRTDGRGTTEYRYDSLGGLRGVSGPAGTVEYEVDGVGRRIRRVVAGRPGTGLLYLDEQRPAATVDAAGTVQSLFAYAEDTLTPTYMARGGRTYRIIVDQTDSPRLVVDAQTGEVVQRLDFDGYGRTLRDTRPEFLPFGYGGGLADPLTGLVRFGHRDYDPENGRWTALDPILYDGGDANLYRYAGNDPVNVEDTDGLNRRRRNVAELPGVLDTTMTIVELLYMLWTGQPMRPDEGDMNEVVEAEIWPDKANPRIVDPLDRSRSPFRTTPPRPSPQARDRRMADESFRRQRRGPSARGIKGRSLVTLPGLCLTPLDCLLDFKQFELDLADALAGLLDSLEFPTFDEDERRRRASEPTFSCGTIDECLARTPDRTASTLTDPHLITFDGLAYDFQGAGEFVSARSTVAGGPEVQLRFSPGGGAAFSYTTAVAARVGGDRVAIDIRDFADDAAAVWVNGVRRPLGPAALVLPGGGRVRPVTPHKQGARQAVVVHWPDGTQLRVEHFDSSKAWFNTTLSVPAQHAGRLAGLLGDADGRRDNDLTVPGGGRVDPADFHAIHRGFADAWRVTGETSLFSYRPGETTATFTDRTFPRQAFTVADLTAAQRAQAAAVCAENGVTEQPFLDQCLVDMTLTGDAEMASAVRAAQVAATPDQFTLQIGDTTAPNLPGPGAGLIEERGARDAYEFAARAGDRIMISTLAVDGDRRCTGNSALRLRVYAPDGRAIDDHLVRHLSGSGTCQHWTFELRSAGTYRLEVSLYEPDVSRGRPDRTSYALSLGPAPRVVRPAALGARLAGEMRYIGQVDIYEFDGRAGEDIVVDVLSVAGDSQCTNAALAWDILSPSGRDLDGPGLTHGVAARDCGRYQVTLPDTGRYQLVLANRTELLGRGASGLGPYEVALVRA